MNILNQIDTDIIYALRNYDFRFQEGKLEPGTEVRGANPGQGSNFSLET